MPFLPQGFEDQMGSGMEVKAFKTPSWGEVALLKSISHFASLKQHEQISKLILSPKMQSTDGVSSKVHPSGSFLTLKNYVIKIHCMYI